MVRFRIECDLAFSRADFWRLRDTPSFLDFVVSDGLLKRMSATPISVASDGWSERCQHYCPAHVDCPDMLRALVGDTMFEVADHQRWHDELAPFQIQFFIRPSFLSGLSKTSGVMLIEEAAEGQEAVKGEGEGEGKREGEVEPAEEVVGGSDGTATDAEVSEGSDAEGGEGVDVLKALAALPKRERSVHVVDGETRVYIMTLGWFVERAIVHNLRQFYKEYPATVARFRQKLYAEFAAGDLTVPCSVVVDRYMESEAGRIAEREGPPEGQKLSGEAK